MQQLTIQPLEGDSFAPFGSVVESTSQGRWINDGNAWRSDCGPLDLDAKDGRAVLTVFRARGREVKGPWRELERHRLGTQSFLPMGAGGCVVLVALGDTAPDPSSLRAFFARPGQGWTLAPGTWHHGLIALKDMDLAVIERQGPTPDCEVLELSQAVTLHWPG